MGEFSGVNKTLRFKVQNLSVLLFNHLNNFTIGNEMHLRVSTEVLLSMSRRWREGFKPSFLRSSTACSPLPASLESIYD